MIARRRAERERDADHDELLTLRAEKAALHRAKELPLPDSAAHADAAPEGAAPDLTSPVPPQLRARSGGVRWTCGPPARVQRVRSGAVRACCWLAALQRHSPWSWGWSSLLSGGGKDLLVTFALNDFLGHSDCDGGSGGYDDIGPATDIVVRGGDGQVIGTAQLGDGDSGEMDNAIGVDEVWLDAAVLRARGADLGH